MCCEARRDEASDERGDDPGVEPGVVDHREEEEESRPDARREPSWPLPWPLLWLLPAPAASVSSVSPGLAGSRAVGMLATILLPPSHARMCGSIVRSASCEK